MPIQARRLIRKMRGGAQAHLIEGGDGRHYVVKFQNNPQHRRVLVNELVAGALLRYLQIAAPENQIIGISDQFLAENPEVGIQTGTRRVSVEPGWHFGSEYPGDPARIAVYDFLPDALISQVVNLHDFLGVLVFDKWIGNADARQSVFFRARLREWIPGSTAHPLRLGFVALMIDNGYAFDGPHWTFDDSPLRGLYFRPMVYEKVTGYETFQPWLDQVVHFPEEVIDEAAKRIPPEWLAGEEEMFEQLLVRLMARRKRVPELLDECRHARANPFPNWR